VNGRYLPDTNIVSAALKNDRLILQRLSEIDYYLSAIVVGELFEWAFSSNRKAERLEAIRAFTESSNILLVDEITGERFGIISTELARRGQPIGDNDIWLVAQASQHHLILVTRDADFGHVPDLKFENW
jgi:tRNA(fMet)-specific endonuclease VapC